MKRNAVFWIKFIVSILICFASILFFSINYSSDLFSLNRTYPLNNPYTAIRDADENLIIKDFFPDGTPKIIKASKDGTVIFVRKGQGRNTGDFYDTMLFACDSNGFIYAEF